MRLLSRHILRSLAAPFGWGVVALTGMLLLNQLAGLITRFGGKGLPFSVMGEAIVLALPALLTLTLPMSVLTASLYAYGQLAADLEMVAMYANGISVWRMARPALAAAVVVAAVNFLIFDQIVPRSNARFTTLQQDVMSKLPTLALRPQVLNPLQNTSYVLRAAEIDPATGAMRDITIYDLASPNGSRVIRASHGAMGEAPNGTDLLLTLYEGEVREVKAQEPGRLERTVFKTNRVRVAGVANLLTRRTGRWDRSDRELTGCELLAGIDSAAWYRKEGKATREFLTRRDLRRLAGLTATRDLPVRPMPRLEPRCVAYAPVERFFERLILGRAETAAGETSPPSEESLTPPPARATETETFDGRLELPIPPPPPQSQPAPVEFPVPAPVVPDAERPAASKPFSTAKPADSTAPAIPGDSSRVTDSLARAREADSLRIIDSVGTSSAAASLPPATPPTSTAPESFQLPNESVGIPGQSFLVPPESAEPAGLVATIVDVNSARYQDERNLQTTREFAVEYHKKFAIPLAAFSFVLVAMALALKYPRSGIGLVIGGSLLIFLGFYVLLIGGENLANEGYISPAVAMYLPLVLFTLLGLVAVAGANREMGSARSSGILQALGEALMRLVRRGNRSEAT